MKSCFPEDFMWGTAEDAYQHEGGNYNNDWYLWELKKPNPIKNDDHLGTGPDFYNRYEEDFQRAADDGQNLHRIGVEWSRIEPEDGVYDEDVLVHYSGMLKSLKDKGFTVILNLWHFTMPIWAAEKGGFENDVVLYQDWPAFVKLCCERFSCYVDLWSTVIDAQIYAFRGWALGDIPPGKAGIIRALRMYSRMTAVHELAYDELKKTGGSNVEVGQIYFFFDFYPASAKFKDKAACRFIDFLFNWKMLNRIYGKKKIDWLGINYYTRQIVSFDFRNPGFIEQGAGSGYAVSDMGWEIFPEGLRRISRKLTRRCRGIPFHITECGIADKNDELRPEFIKLHVQMTSELIKEGIPIKSFTYWSSLDNWEWSEGWTPKFGLYSWDPETLERSPKPSVSLFRDITLNNGLPSEDISGK